MENERKDVEVIFSQALQRDSTDRSGYLDGACDGDTSLRARVEALLEAHEKADKFLSSPTAALDPRALEADWPVAEGPSTRIGRYKLLQRLGEGGFGVVYMAEQQEPVRRKVALKIIKLGMDTKQVIARFEAERQALAMMDHPNIAKVLDAGATETGRPYFVMELVRGVPFTEYCDTNNLSTTERLELFIPICNAIQYAHHKGIIHRDIKPANVMVTFHDTKPVPKVIDFGVAKATNHRLTAKTLFTEYRQLIGTPEYMSPEQAEMSGLDVDTRSDVYSLGVLLYEILTGTTPFESKKLRQAGYVEITRIIREEEPPTPSTRLSMLGTALTDVAKHRKIEPGALSRLMRGDLDWIVMKALEKDRTRRYETPGALVADIERYLRNDAVLASPPSAVYKLGKFIRRNRTGVIAGAMVVGALIVGLALATVGLLQARSQRDAAEEARAEAERASAEAVAEAARSRAIVEALKKTLLSLDPERAEDLNVDVQRVLAIAREVVSEASPVPVPFRKWAHLDAFKATNWDSLAAAVERINELIVEVLDRVHQDRVVAAELQTEIQDENNKLVRFASSIMGQIPTHSPVNGEFSHPAVLTNLMAAMLQRAEIPLETAQKALLLQIGEVYELEYDRLQSTYTAETPRLEKFIDELALKRDSMKRVEEVLTQEQRDHVIVPQIHDRLQVDVLSPIIMAIMLVKPKNLNSKGDAHGFLPGSVAESFGLTPDESAPLRDAWYEEVKPLLETVRDEDTPLHIDEAITAGRAQANLLKAILALKDLDEKTREKALNECTWAVPRVVRQPIEEIQRKIEKLRRGPDERRLADELDNLGKVYEERQDRLNAIATLHEAVQIYQKTLGDSWSSDPLRYRLRNQVWSIALDPERSVEDYEAAKRAAETVLALKPQSATSLMTLGVLQYRLGEYETAAKTLTEAVERRSEEYPGGKPGEIAFLAMAHKKLGNLTAAEAALTQARELMQFRAHSQEKENQQILAEAEALFEAATDE